MLSKNVYVFPPEKRAALEALRHPLAAYQFVDDKLVTLLVSDGMCAMAAMEREALVQLFNTDMYRGTHPDDVARIAELAHRFMIDENEYDVTYRSILYGRMEYRYLQVPHHGGRLPGGLHRLRRCDGPHEEAGGTHRRLQ